MEAKPFIICLSGVAGVGKDTFCKYLKDRIGEYFSVKDFSLAEELKNDVDDFCVNRFSISPWTHDRDKKNLIRPILVAVADVNRNISLGTYYTKMLQPKIDEAILNNFVPIVTDIRYCKFKDTDEVYWAKNNNAIIIHLKRRLLNGSFLKPANEHEALNDPKIRKLADIKLSLSTSDNINDIYSELDNLKVVNKILTIIKKRNNGKSN